MKLLLFLALLLTSCGSANYPKYRLKELRVVPDSLKDKHSRFITETVRAASQHMTGGDYEDVDETIQQAERTANNLFEVKVVGLNLQRHQSDPGIDILPSQFSPAELIIFDSLRNKTN